MKLLFATAALFITVLSTQAQEQETLYRSELPSKVRSFLTYFKSPLHHAVRETDDTKTTYDVVLNDKTLIQFSDKGLWTLIDGKGKAIPYKFLDKPIQEYIKTNYSNVAVTRIERCNSECKMALSNGEGLKFQFDAQGILMATNQ